MGNPLTSDKLIDSIKRRAMIPENQVTFTDADFLAFANEELQLGLVPYILRHHEDYFVESQDFPLETGKSDYAIPSRAIGNRLRDVSFVRSGDANEQVFEMTRIEIQDLSHYDGTYNGDAVHAFYIQNNKVRLKPEIRNNATGSLRMWFYMRPNTMVAESRAATITGINTATGEISLSALPTDASSNQLFSTSTKLDFIMANTPHVTLGFDKTPTAVNTASDTVTFATADLPSDLAVGDYINLACETIVPQIPSDLHMQLAMRVAIRCLEAMGDAQSVQVESAKLEELKYNANSIIDNRVEGAPRKVVNRHGILRDGLFRRRFRFRS